MTHLTAPVPVRLPTIVYIDGFNFYYRVVKGTPYKWLNFAELCRLLLPKNRILGIKYFTAHVSGRANDPDIPVRQQIYLRALKTIPNLEIILGQFRENPCTLPLAGTNPPQFARVVRTEEKGSDVNLAANLVHDGHLRRYEVAVVISDDSDLTEPVRIVTQELGLKVGILTSKRRPTRSFLPYATFYKQIREGVLALSQFPSTLRDTTGEIRKPATW
jgi:hypothetical protein